jgi:tetratricopeptide (TPR) repeat protein
MNKSKPHHPETHEPTDWAESIQNHPAFEWLMSNLQYIPYLFIALLALIALGYKLTAGSAAKAENNYQLAQEYFAQIQRNVGESSGMQKQLEALNELKQITNAYPELHSRYDGMIAQMLLTQGKFTQAEPYAERTLSRTSSDQDANYREFSLITLLVADGKHSEALQKSLTLKETLQSESSEHLLLPYTLIRIAMLYQGMGESELEILAWDEWNDYAKNTLASKPGNEQLNEISTLFTEGDFSLDRFVAERKKRLKM